MSFRKQLLLILFMLLASMLHAQYSYEFLLETSYDDIFWFVYDDKTSNEQILLYTKGCDESDTNCISRRIIYTLTNDGDTIRWPFVDRRDDTLFSINNLIREANGDYFLTGIGWTKDSTGRPYNAFDYHTMWNADHEMLWEKIQQRPPIFDGRTYSSKFNLIKLISGNYLVGKTILTIEPFRFRYFLEEINPENGEVVKEKLMPFHSGEMESLTYSIDSSEIILHTGTTYYRECKRNTDGAVFLDLDTYDTLRSLCYNRDDDDPWKYWCVSAPYDAKIRKDGFLILAGTAHCTTDPQGQSQNYLFVYQYDTSYNLVAKTFLTDRDTIVYGGWYETMDINSNNEICIAGAFNKGLGNWTTRKSWVYLAKLDENLNLISERYLGGDASYEVYSMAATLDGGMVVAGTRYDYLVNNYERDAFVIKTDGGLWVGQPESSSIPVHLALVYPNPGNEQFSIRTTEYPSVVEIYDVYGNLQIVQQIDQIISIVNTSNLSPGLFTWVLKTDNIIIDKGKWIKTNH